jgi:hypothetical protein
MGGKPPPQHPCAAAGRPQMTRERGDADSDQLTHVLMAVFHDWLLLIQPAGGIGSLGGALCGAIVFVELPTPAIPNAGRRTATVTV